MDYETLSAEVLRLADSLHDADDATVAAEVRRLKGLAAQIPDEMSRTHALARAERLPELIAGPRVGSSEQYERAVQLMGEAHGFEGTPEERIAFADDAATKIAALAEQAPARESMTILRMNSSLARLIEELQMDGPQG